jgi:acyl-CoA synthetase (AMP-forming)/AMP-acid ligase II/uncharacterized protein YbdZ (MbtH family)
MFGRRESRYFQLVATEARQFSVWPIGRRPPEGWRVVPFAGSVEACGRHVAELQSVATARAGDDLRDGASAAYLVGLLRKAAGERPEAPALAAGDLRLSYRRLWEIVDDLADRLLDQDTRPGERVAVTGGTPLDQLVVALAVLAAGATCVLSVGGCPKKGIKAVAYAKPDLVLAPAGTVGRRPWWPVVRGRWQGLTGTTWQARAAAEPAAPGGRPGSPAGGALVVLPPNPGAGVVWRTEQLAWLGGYCGLPRLGWGDSLLPPSPRGTPQGVVVALRALLGGAELVLSDGGTRADAAQPDGAGAQPPSRNGAKPAEAGPEPVRWRMRACRGGSQIDEVELLGFAETSMLCAAVLPGTGDLELLPEVGRRVLDAQLNPVPPGEVGELYLAGAPLAAGYLDRPELTMSRFLPDPLGAAEGTLMFHTGSRVRQLSEHRFTIVPPSAGTG